MSIKSTNSKLLDELIAGNPDGPQLDRNFDLILTWLANPDSEKAVDFRLEYARRNISLEILRGYVLYILKQKLFSEQNPLPYTVLGLPKNVSSQQLKSRYRKLIRIYHPDRGLDNPEVLHKYAEKINQAYNKISADLKLEKRSRVDYSINSYAHQNIDNSERYQDNLLIRKLRQKFGHARDFQFKIFAAVVSVCFLMIVFLYFQKPDYAQNSFYKSKYSIQTKTQESTELNKEPIDNTINNDLIVSSNISPDIPASNDHDDNSQFISHESVFDSQSTSIDPAISEVHSKSSVAQIHNGNGPNAEPVNDIETDVFLVSDPLPERVVINKSEDIGSVLEEDRAVNGDSKAQIVEGKLLTILASGADLNVPANHSTGNVSKSSNNDITKNIKVTEKHSPIEISDEEVVNDQKAVETVSSQVLNTLSQIETERKPLESEQSATEQENVPIREVEVVKVDKTPNRYATANLFEKRFAHKFVISYLESIEQGDINEINSFLADTVVINGVSNNKLGFLKYTTQMINNTRKRSYIIKFLGKVLRLDKGSFRVTLRERQDVTYKNNTRSQKSYIKTYEIKRYAHGSEITSISDV